ncbi:LysR family transcriptional regulator [Streptantibioticus cattleyicolor]|uniref:LysR family transcriptional regulator n=1 Tax=Streptantibioticus cattleyicolor (strain ATCC 35852 / DSM 46488 / JCM 4925 / NBRC 14057 / NRRL 8057) TaxID=1003195 RepID=F8JLR7_STREN|nr:LysR family transcriptional regulator [Streptantibioticus cattleyicolor]AEW99501.1 LysR family transcriptional regulator [Streptantibioticus cattleyicolor NRRL 8057 = DSM 46488]CCB71457.1 putative LysR-family transcriptional regulator [Streptantibioticus cattleyicolor NRRL 8057 = DSM 46488]
MTIELRHLRAFLAIAEEGTITRAAARLHVGHPALSRTLRQLESHLGARLVDRSTHHLELTGEGRAFRERARAAVAAVETALEPGSLGGRPLRLGHTWAALGDHTVPLLRRWDETRPGIPLELLRVDDRTAGLTQGKVDAALLRGPVTTAGIRTELLLREERVVVMAADSPLAAFPRLTLADLAPHPIALNTVSGTTTMDLWPPSARPTATVEVTNTDEWLIAIAAGRAVGVSTSATPSTHARPSLIYRPLLDAPAVPVVLAWRDGLAHPAVPDLLALTRQILAA